MRRGCRHCYALVGQKHYSWCPHGDGVGEVRAEVVGDEDAGHGSGGGSGSGDNGDPNIPTPPTLPHPGGATVTGPASLEPPSAEKRPLPEPAPAVRIGHDPLGTMSLLPAPKKEGDHEPSAS